MNVLISGGCKNGKTGFAQDIAIKLSGDKNRYYVATMIPCDDEDRKRIKAHIKERDGMGFKTIETACNISSCIEKAGENGTFLIDSVTALLLNEMFSSKDGKVNKNAAEICIEGLKVIAQNAENAVFVTDYIYSDAARYNDFTENYRKALACVDKFLSKECNVVIELCAGNVIFHKGGANIEKIL